MAPANYCVTQRPDLTCLFPMLRGSEHPLEKYPRPHVAPPPLFLLFILTSHTSALSTFLPCSQWLRARPAISCVARGTFVSVRKEVLGLFPIVSTLKTMERMLPTSCGFISHC